jgi:hypothetical protein
MKLAFLFLIYDEILNEDIWKLFFQNANPDKYAIHIHYKTQKTSRFFESYKLQNCIPTNYSTDTTIARAHNILIKEARKDPSVFKTINLSQSCVPFKSFEYIYEFLTRDDNSHFNLMPMSEWSVSTTTPALKFLRRDEINKAANWFILNVDHAEFCLKHQEEYFRYFENVLSPEEFLYITMLKKHRPEKMICTNFSAEGATTFTNWDCKWGMSYKYPNNSSIKNYHDIREEELNYLLASPCLFGRKFSKNFTLGGGKPVAIHEPYVQAIGM